MLNLITDGQTRLQTMLTGEARGHTVRVHPTGLFQATFRKNNLRRWTHKPNNTARALCFLMDMTASRSDRRSSGARVSRYRELCAAKITVARIYRRAQWLEHVSLGIQMRTNRQEV